jgi:hypothetical protein
VGLWSQQTECGSPRTNFTARDWAQEGRVDDPIAVARWAFPEDQLSATSDFPFTRRSRTKRHLELLQIKKRSIGGLLEGTVGICPSLKTINILDIPIVYSLPSRW